MAANQNGSYAGKVAFVTGAGSGIGRATALAFAREGASVVVADASEQGNRETARMIEELGGRALAVRCDVTRAEDVRSVLDRTIETFGRLDVAFNNAGVEQEEAATGEPSLLAASDVLGTGWFGAVAAEAGPGKTVAVVGDGAVGLLAVLAAKQLGAERIIAMSRHESRQRLAREFGATDIVTERGDEGAARIKELTGGLGAHSVVEAVGTQESMMQAIRSTRAGGHVGFVGVLHDVEIPGEEFFFSHVHLHGGPAPVRRFLPELVDLIWNRKIDPGKVFDLTLPLEEVAEGYRAMDERRAIKTLLRP